MTALGDRMRALADQGHAEAEQLRRHASLFDNAAAGFYGEPQTVDARTFLGCYARARILWCKLTGEQLV